MSRQQVNQAKRSARAPRRWGVVRRPMAYSGVSARLNVRFQWVLCADEAFHVHVCTLLNALTNQSESSAPKDGLMSTNSHRIIGLCEC